MAKAADLIGYVGVILGGNFILSAVAIEETIVCVIPKYTIDKLIESDSLFSLKSLKMIATSLNLSQESILNMAQKSAKERIALTLLMLLDTYGVHSITGTINSNLTREDVANIAGTATESCIRILSEFHNDGLIRVIGKSIKIVNMAKLLIVGNSDKPNP